MLAGSTMMANTVAACWSDADTCGGMGTVHSDISTGAVMVARIPESISALPVEFTVTGIATPPRDPNDDDDDDEDEDDDTEADDEPDPAVIREPDE
jgi:hypothetical protein